jgi:hypothetical protein
MGAFKLDRFSLTSDGKDLRHFSCGYRALELGYKYMCIKTRYRLSNPASLTSILEIYNRHAIPSYKCRRLASLLRLPRALNVTSDSKM